MTSPSAETNDPDPPLLNRTAADRRCSAQPAGGSKPYLALSWASGNLLKTHMPSSAWAIGTASRIARPMREHQHTLWHRQPHRRSLLRIKLETSRRHDRIAYALHVADRQDGPWSISVPAHGS